jgi:hypothetical protein
LASPSDIRGHAGHRHVDDGQHVLVPMPIMIGMLIVCR